MHCKYCGASLSNLSSVCPNCGRLMDSDQLRIKKEINGYNNPYVQRLNEINKKGYREEHKVNNNRIGILLIIGLLLIVLIIFLVTLLNG